MAKGKAAKAGKPAQDKGRRSSTTEVVAKASEKKGVSDALRQAVADLGGDDSDLELIAGVDDDVDEGGVGEVKSTVNEVRQWSVGAHRLRRTSRRLSGTS